MHLVHRTLWTLCPFTITIVFCRLGLKVRLVARWENERLCPKVVVFPQVAHLAILKNFLSCYNSECNEYYRLFEGTAFYHTSQPYSRQDVNRVCSFSQIALLHTM